MCEWVKEEDRRRGGGVDGTWKWAQGQNQSQSQSQHQKQNQSLPARPGQAMPIHFMDGIHCQGHRKPRAELQQRQRQRQQVSPSPPSNPAPPLHSLREVLHGPARDRML